MRRFGTTSVERVAMMMADGQEALLQLMTGGWGLRARADVVALEFAVEGCAADAQHLAGHDFVAVDLFEDALDGGAFDVFEVVGGEGTLGRNAAVRSGRRR